MCPVWTSWKWWPGSESNQRHADFQYGGEPGSARASRRRVTTFRWSDRTAAADRAYTEPPGSEPTEPPGKLKKRKGVGAPRPSGDRTTPCSRSRPALAKLGIWRAWDAALLEDPPVHLLL